MRSLKHLFTSLLIIVLLFPQSIFGLGPPIPPHSIVHDVLKYRKLNLIADKLNILRLQYLLYKEHYDIYYLQLKAASSVVAWGFTPGWDLPLGNPCLLVDWHGPLNRGFDARSAMSRFDLAENWNCRDITSPSLRNTDALNTLASNVAAHGYRSVGVSRRNVMLATVKHDQAWEIMNETEFAKNLQKSALNLSILGGQLSDLQRTNAAILANNAVLLQMESHYVSERVVTARNWSRDSRKALNASGVSSPFTGL